MSEMIEHLKNRYVDLDLHNPIITQDTATFMLYNLSSQLVGWQRYAPKNEHLCSNSFNGRYYTYRTQHQIGFFGMESIKLNSPCVFVTEGIFDIVRLTQKGCAGLALLTNSPNDSMLNQLFCLGKPIIAICDNDKGGDFLKKKLKGLASAYITPIEKDLGDSSQEFIDNIVYTYYTTKS